MNTLSRILRLPLFIFFLLLVFVLVIFNVGASPVQFGGGNTIYLPAIFQRPEIITVELLDGIDSPSSLRFSPDGRLFISERITGKLLVAHKNNSNGNWWIQASPFYTFNTPRDGSGTPTPHASGGLRDIAFDPNFANNGYIYAYYMSDTNLQNRVVRIKVSNSNVNLADSNSETLIFNLPFNNSQATGSHNGGALQFGPDGMLFITTGDGLSGADPVQTLSSFTGKLLRINSNGTIPTDNPFYNQAIGNYRAIYALGLRNPFSMSVHPDTNEMYINDVVSGGGKANVYWVEAGANYQHRGLSDSSVADIGTETNAWARPANAGSEVLTGGAWIPQTGPFSSRFAGAYFTALWGSNNDINGQFNYIMSNSDNTAVSLIEEVGVVDSNGLALKPTHLRRGPDGLLYYLLSTYQTDNGQVWVLIP